MLVLTTPSARCEARKSHTSLPAWCTRILLVAACLSGGAAAPRPADAAGTEVQRIRHRSAPDRTRVVLDLSAPPTYRHSLTAADPPSLILEIEGGRMAASAQSVTIDDGLIDRVRLLAPEGGVAQVVVELRARRQVKVFALAAASGKPDRLVVDVLRAEGDPPPPQADPEPQASDPPQAPAAPAPDSTRAAAAPTPPATQPSSTQPPPAASPEPTATMPSSQTPSPPKAPAAGRSAERNRPWIVIVDPGHGGDDPGARGPGGVLEKDVCLALGRSLAAELNRRPGIKAILTRDGDYFLTLRRRTRLAAEKKADLFVSVHANANRNKKVHGTEVYFLSLRGASDSEAREVATRENAADQVAGVPPDSQEDIENIIMDLMRTAALERSSELAATVIERLDADNRLVIRGVKQAGFDVLKTAGMPSILIEAAFISHAKEAKLLKNRDFQQRFGSLVGGAVVEFLARTAAAEPAPAAAKAEPAAAEAKPAGTSPAGS